jgi:hypothetical protein
MSRRRRLERAWTECCVATLQGPAQLLLAQGGKFEPVSS